MTDHKRALVKLLHENSRRHHAYRVWGDFVEIAALAISNVFPHGAHAEREERFLQTLKRYEPDEQQRFPAMLAELTLALEHEPGDVLGEVFGELEMGNQARGQVFTPYSLCQLMADVAVDEDQIRSEIQQRGYMTVLEPAAGAGALVIAMAQRMRKLGINYQQHLHVEAWDVDPRAAHMAYIQFSLLHIPAVVVNGNTISQQVHERFYTPAHMLGFWENKLRRGYVLGSGMDTDEGHELFAEPPRAPVPPSVTLRQLDMFEQEQVA